MSIGFIFGALLIMLLLPDAYIVFSVMKGISWWWRALFLFPTALYIAVAVRLFVVGDTRQFFFNVIFWLTLCVVFPILLFTVISILGKALTFINPRILIIFNWIGLGIGAVWLLGALYGIGYGWRKVTVEDVNLYYSNLPKEFEGYKIVQLSDLHIGTYELAPATVEKIVEKVNSLHPDLIVFTGDLVNMDPSEITPFAQELAKLQATDGVIAILGNHDYCLYQTYKDGYTAEKALRGVIEKEKEMGWKLLLNENTKIKRGEAEIALIGVENSGGNHFIDRSDLKGALKGVEKGDFKILLTHDPSHWRREVIPSTDIDLTLSGHTHAMQFKIGDFSPSKWTYKEWGGLYNDDERFLHVNTGTGGNIAFRFGAYPQITLITLNSK